VGDGQDFVPCGLQPSQTRVHLTTYGPESYSLARNCCCLPVPFFWRASWGASWHLFAVLNLATKTTVLLSVSCIPRALVQVSMIQLPCPFGDATQATTGLHSRAVLPWFVHDLLGRPPNSARRSPISLSRPFDIGMGDVHGIFDPREPV
jgi:hypothetical protein